VGSLISHNPKDSFTLIFERARHVFMTLELLRYAQSLHGGEGGDELRVYTLDPLTGELEMLPSNITE
jgi:hypothetical protein